MRLAGSGLVEGRALFEPDGNRKLSCQVYDFLNARAACSASDEDSVDGTACF
jgi:hypothetical protein